MPKEYKFAENQLNAISQGKKYRTPLIVKYRSDIIYWADHYNVPPEMVAGILFMEHPRIDDYWEPKIDFISGLGYDLVNLLPFTKDKRPTVGPAQISAISATKEMALYLPKNELDFYESFAKLSMADKEEKLRDPRFAIRYVAFIMWKTKVYIKKYGDKRPCNLTTNQKAEIIRQWNSNNGINSSYPNYAGTVIALQYYLRSLLGLDNSK